MALLEVKNLCKSFPTFNVKNVSFSIEPGYIVGFIGRNGAGKTTTIKSILNLTKADSGSVSLFGMDLYEHEIEIKQRIGVVLGGFDYYLDKKLRSIAQVVSRFYDNWDGSKYLGYLKKFNLDENKRVKELSEGMKVKLALALALSHHAELLILDEPTSGLDPVSRDELMTLFRSIVADGECSILFSTQITSDLDKCADYVIYIKDGGIIMQGDREEIIDGFRLVQGPKEALTPMLRETLVGYKETAFGFNGLIREQDLAEADGLSLARADIESIMVYTERNNGGEQL